VLFLLSFFQYIQAESAEADLNGTNQKQAGCAAVRIRLQRSENL